MAATTTSTPALSMRQVTGKGLAAAGLLVAVAAWLAWNFTESPAAFLRVSIIGLQNGALYALIALGYTLVYGIIELINFAHGDLFMLGSLFGMFLLGQTGQDASNPATWLLLIAIIAATMLFCATLNMAIERVAYRPLRNAPKLAPLITAIGMSFILQNIGLIWNGPGQVSVPVVLPNEVLFTVGGVGINSVPLIIVGVTIPLLLLLTWIVRSTKPGKAMRATAQDADGARLMGINVNRTIAFTFALGGLMAGAAGVLYAQAVSTTRWDAGFQLGLISFTAAVLGGIGNLRGAVLGAVLIGFVQALNEGLPHGAGAQWSQSLVFSILILILVFKPEGLLGEQTPEKV
jgi:branched-chain amino acid transport system permease protein